MGLAQGREGGRWARGGVRFLAAWARAGLAADPGACLTCVGSGRGGAPSWGLGRLPESDPSAPRRGSRTGERRSGKFRLSRGNLPHPQLPLSGLEPGGPNMAVPEGPRGGSAGCFLGRSRGCDPSHSECCSAKEGGHRVPGPLPSRSSQRGHRGHHEVRGQAGEERVRAGSLWPWAPAVPAAPKWTQPSLACQYLIFPPLFPLARV